MTDALKRASAGRITAAIPYFGYARQDRRPRSARVPITAKVVADMLTTVGVNRVMVMDLHADQIQGFFNIPVDNIYATPILLGDLWKQNYDDVLVVSPDVGGVVRARAIAKRLDSDLAIIDKRRPRANVAEVMNIIGDVNGRSCVIMDDIVDTANTLCKAATALKEHGAKKVVAYCTHAVLSGGAVQRIATSELDETRGLGHDPAHRGGAGLSARPRAVLRAAPRRDDDPGVQRGVGELALHGVALEAEKELYFKAFPGTGDVANPQTTGRTAPTRLQRRKAADIRSRTMSIEFTAFPRTTEGRGASRRMRRAGKAPGIVYGGTHAPQPIELDHNALFHALRNEAFHASILSMSLDGKTTKVLLRDVQMHPFKNEILHVDFQRIDENRKIHMKVPLHFANGETSPAVKVSGAIVSHVITEIDISCLPKDLPEFITVDLSTLDVGHSVHVSALQLPAGCHRRDARQARPRGRRRRRSEGAGRRDRRSHAGSRSRRGRCSGRRHGGSRCRTRRGRKGGRREGWRQEGIGRQGRQEESRRTLSPLPAPGPAARIPAGLFVHCEEAVSKADGHLVEHPRKCAALTAWRRSGSSPGSAIPAVNTRSRATMPGSGSSTRSPRSSVPHFAAKPSSRVTSPRPTATCAS